MGIIGRLGTDNRHAWLLAVVVLMIGCASYPPRKELDHIRVGMSRAQLKNVLGKPERTGRRGDLYYMKYYLANKAAVATAFYFLFDSDLRLVKWEEDRSDEVVDKEDVASHLFSPM